MRETRLWILGFDPSSVGYEASIWEQAKNTVTGTIYVKVGPDNTDWVPAPIGGSSGPVISVNGTAGRISSSGGNSPVIDLVNTAVTPGSYTYSAITVDASGRITAASNGTTPAPVDATYITQTPSATLTNEQALSALSSGVMQVTTTTGVVDSFVVGTGLIPYGSSSKLATASTFGYNAANGTFAVGVAPGSAISTVKAHIAGSANGEVSIVVQNTNSGSSAYASLYFLNDTAGRRADVYFTSTTYSGADAGPSSVVFSTSPSSGSVIFAPKLVRTLSLDGSNSNFEAGNALFTRAGVQLIEKQGSGDFYVGTLGAQLLGLYTNNVTRVSIASGGGVTLSSLTGATTGIVSVSTTGLLGRASSADIAGNITWPAAGTLLVSTSTSTAPTGYAGIAVDSGDDAFVVSDGFRTVHNNLGFGRSGNYEAVTAFWSADLWTLKSVKGGTGVVRSMTVDADTANLTLHGANTVNVNSDFLSIAADTSAGIMQATGWSSITLSTGLGTAVGLDATRTVVQGSPTVASSGSLVLDAIRLSASVTFTSHTAITTATGVNAVSIPSLLYVGDGSGPAIDLAASFYIAAAPVAASGVSFGKSYSIWADQGVARFDGDTAGVFELPADATTAGSHVGRIKVVIGGATRYLHYYDG